MNAPHIARAPVFQGSMKYWGAAFQRKYAKTGAA